MSYQIANQLDSALKYIQIVDEVFEKFNGNKWAAASYELGNIYLQKGDYTTALNYYRTGVSLAISVDNNKDLMDNYNGLASTFKKKGVYDSAVVYAGEVLEVSNRTNYVISKLQALDVLSEIYQSKNNIDSLAKYLQLTIATKDSLFSQRKVMQIQTMTFNEQLRQQELQQQLAQAKLVYRNRLNIYFLLAGLVILIIVAGGLWRRNVFKQRSYALLQKQKQEIDFQKTKVEKTLEELKSTQAQLIQSEKMASLGELTAGIAHEIQNPLNFVNNFSEVNKELIKEMVDEVDKGNGEEAKAIAYDVQDNMEKILLHGKRADGIVKGMLQHSRASSGQKELIDINKLADEYLRLSYHGMRARDKSFDSEFETDFDETNGKINVVPQDIGRVFLNIINNAFYAVNERHKLEGEGFKAMVSIQTKKLNDKVQIIVKDNGNGIPKNIVDKIFQPFFTTKPTGQGTGLGLSLAYDIIKAHGGEIKVETQENEGSDFIIQLPIT
jgi:signal transduction histidine kinase